MTLALLLLGPLCFAAPSLEREIAADHAQMAATVRCLVAAHRLLVPEPEAGRRCGLGEE